jgi:hypothetical protein
MAKKERKEKKEKPLEKMTIKELKDIALEIPNIAGVHGMNKNELIEVIKEDRGIADEGKKEKAIDTRAIKKQIAELKEEKAKLLEEGDKKKLEILRKKMSRLKKKTRQAA